jgi:leucyl aminopeptidase
MNLRVKIRLLRARRRAHAQGENHMQRDHVLIADSSDARPLDIVPESQASAWLKAQPAYAQAHLQAQRFEARRYSQGVLYANDGSVDRAVVVVKSETDVWGLGLCATTLPPVVYRPGAVADAALVGFALGSYQFLRYRPAMKRNMARLAIDAERCERLNRIVAAAFNARDLVNTPTEDLGPEHLEAHIRALGQAHGATLRSIVGDDLLREHFPAIHAVGRASHRAPRLIELVAGNPAHPAIAIVGKGVCFDTGGLDIKPPDGMALMKKDMGGAAVAIELARLVLEARLPVHLRLLVPAVENALGPDAYRPGEVIATRAGVSVEIGNTDAEGRVILCDALTYAVEQKPSLILDFATLTGAARIALGPDLPALFCNDDNLSTALLAAGKRAGDPLWPMPLWEDYFALLESKIADINNAGASKMAGAVTAALYLKRFVPDSVPWAHLDTYCWSEGKPGRPAGGDCQGLRAAFAYLEARFAA